MKRRPFIGKAIAALAAPLTLSATPVWVGSSKEIIKPGGLKAGARIGLVAPSGALSRSGYERMIDNLARYGYEAVPAEGLRSRTGFLAATDRQRVADLHAMFADPTIDAVFCARGGYGAARIIDALDYSLIAQNPKPLLGFSDITALLLAIYHKTGLVGFHGPIASGIWTDFSIQSMIDVLFEGKKVNYFAQKPIVIKSGKATGKLIGGNLSLLTSLIGTAADPNYSGHILFIEEIGESTYRIDRMLTQLLSAGKLKNVAGIALGYFTKCDTPPDDPFYEYSVGLREVFEDRLGGLGVPVCTGFPFGHEDDNVTLPIGIMAELHAQKGELRLLESAIKS